MRLTEDDFHNPDYEWAPVRISSDRFFPAMDWLAERGFQRLGVPDIDQKLCYHPVGISDGDGVKYYLFHFMDPDAALLFKLSFI